MREQALLEKVCLVEWGYKENPKYSGGLSKIAGLVEQGRFDEVGEALKQFPDGKKLLEDLVGKLEGKSVHKTLERIANNKTEGKWEILKGLFSLGTHASIEAEKGSPEYKIVLLEVWEKLGDLLFEA